MIKPKADDHGVGLRTVVWRWSDVGIDEAIEPLHLKGAKPLSFQVLGEFDGARAHMIGSNDAMSWDVLTDILGVPIDMHRSALAPISMRSQFIAPSVTNAGNGTKLTFLVLVEMPQ